MHDLKVVAGMNRRVKQKRTAVATDQGSSSSDDPLDVEAAFVEHEAKLLRYVGHLLGGITSEAEDVVQDAFLRLHTQVHVKKKGGQIRNVAVWLFRVAHNLAMDTGRKKTRHRKLQPKVAAQSKLLADDEVSIDALGQLERAEAGQQAMAQLEALPEAQRSVVVLQVIEGMTVKQIAQVTGTSPSNACYRLRDAMETLSSRLRSEGVI
jgi:RNA polymerase sigma-70 factor (ECF subfamily)